MNRLLIATLAVAVAVAVILFVFFRYQFYPANEATVIWRTDRVTGAVELCYSSSGRIQCEGYASGQPWKPQ